MPAKLSSEEALAFRASTLGAQNTQSKCLVVFAAAIIGLLLSAALLCGATNSDRSALLTPILQSDRLREMITGKEPRKPVTFGPESKNGHGFNPDCASCKFDPHPTCLHAVLEGVQLSTCN